MRVVLVLFCVLFCIPAFSQMMLTPSGFRDEKDTTKSYVVIDYPKLSKTELYTRALAYLNKSKAVNVRKIEVTPTDFSSIYVSGESEPMVIEGRTLYLRFAVSFDFKDEKMRYDVVDVTFEAKGGGGETFKIKDKYKKGHFIQSVYSLDNKLVSEYGKKHIEAFYNRILNQVIESSLIWDRW